MNMKRLLLIKITDLLERTRTIMITHPLITTVSFYDVKPLFTHQSTTQEIKNVSINWEIPFNLPSEFVIKNIEVYNLKEDNYPFISVDKYGRLTVNLAITLYHPVLQQDLVSVNLDVIIHDPRFERYDMNMFIPEVSESVTLTYPIPIIITKASDISYETNEPSTENSLDDYIENGQLIGHSSTMKLSVRVEK